MSQWVKPLSSKYSRTWLRIPQNPWKAWGGSAGHGRVGEDGRLTQRIPEACRLGKSKQESLSRERGGWGLPSEVLLRPPQVHRDLKRQKKTVSLSFERVVYLPLARFFYRTVAWCEELCLLGTKPRSPETQCDVGPVPSPVWLSVSSFINSVWDPRTRELSKVSGRPYVWGAWSHREGPCGSSDSGSGSVCASPFVANRSWICGFSNSYITLQHRCCLNS